MNDWLSIQREIEIEQEYASIIYPTDEFDEEQRKKYYTELVRNLEDNYISPVAQLAT